MFKSEIILMLLFSYAVNYPILWDWGLTLSKPIGLVFSDLSMTRKFCGLLSQQPYLSSMTEKKNVIACVLAKANSEAVCLFYRNSKTYQPKNIVANIDQLLLTSQFGEVSGHKARTATFIAFYGFVPDELKAQVLEVHVEGHLPQIKIAELMALLPNLEQLSIVEKAVKDFDLDECLALKAAAAFLLPALERDNRTPVYIEMLATAKRLISAAEDYREIESVKCLVIKAFVEYYSMKKPPVMQIAELEKDDDVDVEKAFLLDNNLLYVREKLFKAVVSKLTEVIPVDLIKERLVNEKVLLGQKGEYTKKMNLIVGGKTQYIRMLCLDLDQMPELDSYFLEM